MCPYYKNKEVADSFNEIISALGGRPLTDEEFRSAELRRQRSGRDFSAMETAYRCYHLNNGNFLEKAPNGKDSILFKTLLDHYDGDRNKAISAKTRVYSDEFFNWFGDWENAALNSIQETAFKEALETFENSNTTIDKRSIALSNLKPNEKSDEQVLLDAGYKKVGNMFVSPDFDKTILSIIPTQLLKIMEKSGVRVLSFGKGGYSAMAGGIKVNGHSIGEIRFTTDNDASRIAHNVLHEIGHYLYNHYLNENERNSASIYNSPISIYIKNLINGTRTSGASIGEENFVEGFATYFHNKIFGNRSIITNIEGHLVDLYRNLYKEFGNNNNASKVVDENGEPLVVYHHTDNSNLTEFSTDFDNYFAKDGGTKEAIFFDENKTWTLNRNYDIPVFLNIKDLHEYTGTKEQLHQKGTTYRQVVNESAAENNIDGGIHMKDFDDNKMEHQSIWIVHNPNQIKSATDNNGEFSTTNNSVYNIKTSNKIQNLLSHSLEESFGEEISDNLNKHVQVSSKDLCNSLIERSLFTSENIVLSKILKQHDIPVVMLTLPGGVLMRTVFDRNGGAYIAIDKDMITAVSSEFLSKSLSHEIIHALTRNAIYNPTDSIDIEFKKLTQEIFDLFDTLLPSNKFSRIDYDNGYYILNNVYEFPAVFATDASARSMIYKAAEVADNKRISNKIKKFINAFTKKLLNVEFFRTNKNKELVSTYEKTLTSYLQSRKQIRHGNLKDKNIIDTIYNSLSNKTLSEDYRALLAQKLAKYSEFLHGLNIKIHKDVTIPQKTKEDIQKMNVEELRSYIANALTIRAAAIKNEQNISKEEKVKKINALNQEIQRFESEHTTTFRVLSDFILSSIDTLKNNNDYIHSFENEDGSWSKMNPDEYMILRHTDLGLYKNIYSHIANALDLRSVQEHLVKELKTTTIDKSDLIKDVKTLLFFVSNGLKIAEECEGYLNSILSKNVSSVVLDTANEVHDLTISEYLNDLLDNTASFDESAFFTSLWSIDSAKDPILRTMNTILTKAINIADRKTYNKVKRLIPLLNKLSEREINQLYEKDKNGNATQYLIRSLNYGKMLLEMKDMYAKLNQKFGLPKDNRIAPADPEKAKEYNSAVEKWMNDNVERPFVDRYYKAFSKLSPFTKKHREDIMIEIHALNSKAFDPEKYGDEYYHYELLSQSERNRLEELNMWLKLLKSDTDIHGNMKEGEALQIARELQQLDKDLYEGFELEYDTDRWKLLRDEMIEECGGLEAYKSGDKKKFDFKKFNTWDRLNTRMELKRDPITGQPLIFQYIEDQIDFESGIVYEVDGDNGARYEELKQLRNSLLYPARDKYSGEVNPRLLRSDVIKKIKQIDKEMRKIKNKAINKNKDLKKALNKKRELLKKYVTFEQSKLYIELKENARKEGEEALIAFLYSTGYGSIDSDEDPYEPYSFYKIMKVRPEYERLFVDIKPGSGFLKKDGKGSYRNKNYNETFGEYLVPKDIEKYRNKDFKNLSENQIAVYNEIRRINIEISELYGFNKRSEYQLPSITGGLLTYLRGSGDKITKTIQYASDMTGINSDEFLRQTGEFGQDISSLLLDEYGELVYTETIRTIGQMPDGRELKMIPRHYMAKLENPYTISRDLGGIVLEAYKQALRFSEKSKVKNTLEMLYDYLGDRVIKENRGVDVRGVKKIKEIKGLSSKSREAAKKYLNMNLYDIRQQRGNAGGVEFGRLVSIGKQAATLLNLGYKPSIALVGALTAQASSYVQAVVGSKYDQKEFFAGLLEVFLLQIKSYSTGNGIAQNDTSNKLEILAELFDIAGQLERVSKLSNTNRFVRGVRLNLAYMFMTFADFYTKSCIMVSTLMSLKYIDGYFVNEEDLRNSEECWKMSDKEFKDFKKQINFDKIPSLYSLIDINENHEIVIKERTLDNGETDNAYQKAFDELFNLIKLRINKMAESADGIPTELLKSAFSATIVGSLMLLHRLYFPLMLQNRFAQMTYDQDTQQMNNGVFRTLGSVYALMVGCISPIKYDKNAKFKFTWKGYSFDTERTSFKTMSQVSTIGALTGLALVSPFVGVTGGLVTGGVIGLITALSRGKSLNKLFHDKSDRKSAMESRARSKHLKLVLTEMILYKTIIQPLAPILTLIFQHLPWVDLDDDDSWWTRIYWLLEFVINKFGWEMYTPYRADDAMNNIKSFTAATSTLDATERISKGVQGSLEFGKNTLWSQTTLWDTFNHLLGIKSEDSDLESFDPLDEYVSRGAYSHPLPYIMDEPFTKKQRNLFKSIPIKNLFEEMYGSKEKLNYFKHQVMQETED